MATNKKTFVMYCDILSTIQKLHEDDKKNKTNNCGELFLQILRYVNDEDPDPVNFIVELAFEPIKVKLKHDLKDYRKKIEQRSFAGRVSAEKRNSTNVNETQQIQQTLTTVNEESEKPKTKRFEIPSILEVEKYCKERNNSVDPVKFINFYASKGWMIGKTKMKDWKACVRTWEGKENEQNSNQNVKYSAKQTFDDAVEQQRDRIIKKAFPTDSGEVSGTDREGFEDVPFESC